MDLADVRNQIVSINKEIKTLDVEISAVKSHLEALKQQHAAFLAQKRLRLAAISRTECRAICTRIVQILPRELRNHIYYKLIEDSMQRLTKRMRKNNDELCYLEGSGKYSNPNYISDMRIWIKQLDAIRGQLANPAHYGMTMSSELWEELFRHHPMLVTVHNPEGLKSHTKSVEWSGIQTPVYWPIPTLQVIAARHYWFEHNRESTIQTVQEFCRRFKVQKLILFRPRSAALEQGFEAKMTRYFLPMGASGITVECHTKDGINTLDLCPGPKAEL